MKLPHLLHRRQRWPHLAAHIHLPLVLPRTCLYRLLDTIRVLGGIR